MQITTRYAQAKTGQKLHIVPEIGAYNMANVALCGKRVDHWHATFNVPLGHCCKNCDRIDRKRGYQRAIEIARAIISAM